MGRWAQRERAGGGATPASSPISITLAVYDAFFSVTLTYSADINVADFAAADFISQPSGINPIIVAQGTSSELVLTLDAGSLGDTSIDYAGAAPNVLTPQSITYT